MKTREWCLFDVHDTLVSSKVYMSLYQPIVSRLVSEKGVPFTKLNKEMERLKGMTGTARADTYDLCDAFNALDLYYQELSKHLRFMPIKTDVVKLFEALNDMGKKIGIISNSHNRTVKLILEHHGLLERIEWVFARDEAASKGTLPFWKALMAKHNIDPDNTIVIDNDATALDTAALLGFKTVKVSGIIDFNIIKHIP